jgi:hypothetical protein
MSDMNKSIKAAMRRLSVEASDLVIAVLETVAISIRAR